MKNLTRASRSNTGTSLRERKEKMSSLVSESDSCIAERSSLETQIEDERASSRRMQSSLESSRSELRSLKNEFEIKSESCKNEISSLRVEAKHLEDESILLRDTLERRETNLETSRNALDLLSSKLQELTGELDRDRVEFRSVNEKDVLELTNVSKSLAQKRVTLNNLRLRVEKLEEEKRSLETQLRVRKEKMPSESGRVNLAREESRLITSKLEKQIQQRRELEESVESFEIQLMELKSRSHKKAAEVRHVQSKLRRQKDDLDETQRRVELESENLKLLKSRLEDFSSKFGRDLIVLRGDVRRDGGGENVMTSVARLISELSVL